MKDVSSYLSFFMEEAAKRRASDIHLEPQHDYFQIRMRTDGVLLLFEQLEEAWGPPLISKLKLLAGMDIGERRLPQDGAFAYEYQELNFDVRASTLPTLYGEKIVLRLLNRTLPFQHISSLGLDTEQCHTIRKLLSASQGLILATGPTGSGKTTTLHTLLHEIEHVAQNIIALEDPIEYHVSGVNQVQVNPRAGLTFSLGLRASLRQDPDVIFVGEIRDKETAEIAIRAALTGHKVLSSLHTADAAGTITRLLDMGIEPYLVSSALTGIISQRLVRRICSCADDPCPVCQGTGYAGRQAVFEVLPVHEDLHPFIIKRSPTAEIRSYLRNQGFCSLNMKLREQVRRGVTTINEYKRVLIADVE